MRRLFFSKKLRSSKFRFIAEIAEIITNTVGMANRRELSHFVLDFDMKTSIKVIQNVTLIAGYGVAIIGKHFIPFLKLLLLLW